MLPLKVLHFSIEIADNENKSANDQAVAIWQHPIHHPSTRLVGPLTAPYRSGPSRDVAQPCRYEGGTIHAAMAAPAKTPSVNQFPR
jgi:hypothetical protein